MAVLQHRDKDARCILLSRHLVGRSRISHLRMSEPHISGEHASLYWTGSGWEVHDLGSRNGTFVNDRKLDAGERALVRRGDTVAFGRLENAWQLVDDSPPAAMALPRTGGAPICAESGLLALPGVDEPAVMIYQDRSGEWMCEQEDRVYRVGDGHELEVDGAGFTLHIPAALAPTLGAGEDSPTIDSIALRFAVSQDEEYVELAALHENQIISLGTRAHHYVLLTLARLRLRDRREAVSEATRGWVYQDELASMLHMDEKHLNISVFRCRQQLSAAGVVGAAAIVERRKPTRQLRLGVDQVEIVRI